MWSLAVLLISSLRCLALLRSGFHRFATPIGAALCAVTIVQAQPCRRPLR
ncbi:hypothetical protein [Pseudomonas sp. BN411]|nr:hypothetical protein [Pseudomonas sp. BN411]